MQASKIKTKLEDIRQSRSLKLLALESQGSVRADNNDTQSRRFNENHVSIEQLKIRPEETNIGRPTRMNLSSLGNLQSICSERQKKGLKKLNSNRLLDKVAVIKNQRTELPQIKSSGKPNPVDGLLGEIEENLKKTQAKLSKLNAEKLMTMRSGFAANTQNLQSKFLKQLES